MKKNYIFADIEISIDIPEERMYVNDGVLSEFRTETVKNPHIFTFKMVDELTAPEGNNIFSSSGYRIYEKAGQLVRYIGSVKDTWEQAYMRIEHSGKNHKVQVKTSKYSGRLGVHTVLNTLAVEHLITESGGFVFHCSFIEWNGEAILFTAPSGVGKSTQAELWKKYRNAKVMNGDRAAVMIKNGQIMAEGIPFSGSSKYCKQCSVPVKAIVYLSQASENSVKELNGREAFFKLWEGITINTWDKKDVDTISKVVSGLVGQVPIYHLACTPDESAVLALESELSKLTQSTLKEHNSADQINLNITIQPIERK